MLYAKLIKHIERDNFEKGCCIGTARAWSIDVEIKGKDKASFIANLLAFCGGDESAMMIAPCEDDPSRVDVQTTENDDGRPPTESQLAEWKAGRIDLWAVTYTAYVEEVTRRPANLLED